MERSDRANAGTYRRSRPRRIGWALLGTLVALALLVIAGLSVGGCSFEFGNGSDTTTATAAPTTQGDAATTSTSTAATGGSTVTSSSGTVVTGGEGLSSPAAKVASILAPSVVFIKVTGASSQGPFGAFQYEASGSGVIYTPDGMIITNNHVVSDETTGEAVDEITVTLTTGEKLPATIVGRDPLTDLAVIKVNSDVGLPAATFNTQLPQVGEYAIAVGSPLGFTNSVSMGIVSALDRTMDVQSATGEVTSYFGLIQTDAPINSGNSGGALANASGQVIGINSIKTDDSISEGLGFAIPSSTVTNVADQIISTGKATHAYMGVGTRTVTEDLQQQFGLSRASGVLVAEVTAGGPAEAAGIQRGDILISIDDQELSESSDLLQAIRNNRPGDAVQVELDRNGQTMQLTVTLVERPTGL